MQSCEMQKEKGRPSLAGLGRLGNKPNGSEALLPEGIISASGGGIKYRTGRNGHSVVPEVFGMKTIVKQKTEIIGGKPVVFTITREIGLQEIEVGGERITVGELVTTESRLGRTRTYTRDPRGVYIGPEAGRQAVAVATQAMIDQGIW